jgi:drug/metabolite transporter (DMT)-like permease
VILWGFTAILGKAISLPALPLVWWRMLIVTGAVMLIRQFWTGLGLLTPRLICTYAGIGLLVAVHWLTFYGSIKLSNASVAAVCIALTPVFVAFVEPILAGRTFDVREVFFGMAVVPGVALVVGGTPTSMRPGIAAGVLSAFILSIFGSLNKRFIERGTAITVTGLEMAAGAIFLTLAGSFLSTSENVFVMPGRHDGTLLFVLAIGCTLVPFVLSLVALRHLTAFSSALAVNLEPVYAILLAIAFFGEQRQLDGSFYAGVAIILAVVFSHPLIVRTTPISSL